MQNKIQSSTEEPSITTPNANHTNDLIEGICNNADLPALGSSMSRVIRASSSEDRSIQQLAEFILLDASLTQKILFLSNSVSYRSESGRVVTSISKAIHMLGVNTVRTCAMAIILVDGLPHENAQCVRSELARALTASIIGRELAKHIYFKDVEEVAIAALFKNIGNLLVASYDPNLYWEIMGLIKEDSKTSEQASRQVLGCSFDRLTEVALQKSNIPESIIQSMKAIPQGKILTIPKTRQDWIRQALDFSETITPTMLQDKNPEEETLSSAALLTRFGKVLNLDKTNLDKLFFNIRKETETLNISMDLVQQDSKNRDTDLDNVTASKKVKKKELPSEMILADKNPDDTKENKYYPSGKPFNASSLLTTNIQHVTKIIVSGHYKVSDILNLLLRSIYVSFRFNFATIFLKDVSTSQFRARCFIGKNNAIKDDPICFSVGTSNDLFNLALEKDTDLFISDASTTKVRSLIPPWHRKFLPKACSFMVLPLVINKKPLGLLYADRNRVSEEGISANEMSLIKLLKGQVLTALSS